MHLTREQPFLLQKDFLTVTLFHKNSRIDLNKTHTKIK